MLIANDDLNAQSWNTNFRSNPFEDGPSEFSQDTEDAKYTPIQIADDNHPPSQDLRKIVVGAQWNRPLNQMIIMKMKFHNTSVKMIEIPKNSKRIK